MKIQISKSILKHDLKQMGWEKEEIEIIIAAIMLDKDIEITE